MRRNTPRSGCPINLTLEALGDRWSLIVIRDLMFGNRRHFRELLTRSEERIASNILADVGIPSRQSQPQAEGHLQPDRRIHRSGALAGPHGRLGPASDTRLEKALRTREILEDGGPKLWSEFMEELRHLHLEAPAPRGSVFSRLQSAYEAAIAKLLV